MSDQIEVQVGSQNIQLSVEGGTLAAGMSLALTELNAAVQEAEAAALAAQQAAIAAEYATTNKLDRDGSNLLPDLLANIDAVSRTNDFADVANKAAALTTLGGVSVAQLASSIANEKFVSISEGRRVPSAFVQGDGATIRRVFPTSINGTGVGSYTLSVMPRDDFANFGFVKSALANYPEIWVSPTGNDANDGLTRATPITLRKALQDVTTNVRIMMPNIAPYNQVPLRYGTHAGAAAPKWLVAVDGPVTIQPEGSLGQPTTQTWTLQSGVVYKTVLSSVDYDRPQRMLKLYQPDPLDGMPSSMRKYASIADLTALGSTGEGWWFDAATDTLYMTYYGTDLSVSGNRAGFEIIWSDKALDSLGQVGAEWILGGASILFDGDFLIKGMWLDAREEGGRRPILYSQGNLTSFCSSWMGIRNEGLAFMSGLRVVRSRNDGANGYGTAGNITGMTILHDYICQSTGDLDNFGPSPGFSATQQGASWHGYHNGMIFGAMIENSYGQGIADISQTGHVSASWVEGVVNRNNFASGGISNGFYFDQTAGGQRLVWIGNSVSIGNTRSVVALGSAVKVTGSYLPPIILTGSGGTVAAYNPATPG